jgi:hypothetical protein
MRGRASESSNSRYFNAHAWNIEYWWLYKTYMHVNSYIYQLQSYKWGFLEVMMMIEYS